MTDERTPLRRFLAMTPKEREMALERRRRARLPPDVEDLRREMVEFGHVYRQEAEEALLEMAAALATVRKTDLSPDAQDALRVFIGNYSSAAEHEDLAAPREKTKTRTSRLLQHLDSQWPAYATAAIAALCVVVAIYVYIRHNSSVSRHFENPALVFPERIARPSMPPDRLPALVPKTTLEPQDDRRLTVLADLNRTAPIVSGPFDFLSADRDSAAVAILVIRDTDGAETLVHVYFQRRMTDLALGPEWWYFIVQRRQGLMGYSYSFLAGGKLEPGDSADSLLVAEVFLHIRLPKMSRREIELIMAVKLVDGSSIAWSERAGGLRSIDACDNVRDQPDLEIGMGALCIRDNDCIRGVTIGGIEPVCLNHRCVVNADTDGDLRADPCDEDDDADGVSDGQDNCKTIPNLNQADSDKNGRGDACDHGADIRFFKKWCDAEEVMACGHLAKAFRAATGYEVPRVMKLSSGSGLGRDCSGECAPIGMTTCYELNAEDVHYNGKTFCLPRLNDGVCLMELIPAPCPTGTFCEVREINEHAYPTYAACVNRIADTSPERKDVSRPLENQTIDTMCTGECGPVGMTWCGDAIYEGSPYEDRWLCTAERTAEGCLTKAVAIPCPSGTACVVSGMNPSFAECR